MKKKVYVGLSGGVDSSVSAALLQRDGYDVVGVFIKVWQPEGIPCTWKEDRLDAMRIAAQLNIPFYTLDLEKEYKEGVVDYMLYEYKKGRTPNPDIMCNKTVKFGAFLSWALIQGADYVATGHYARTRLSKNGNKVSFLKGIDTNKDQSYFLWTLTQEQLKHILFPIGLYTKDKVRAIAFDLGLHTADKKDSQGLCFIGKLDMKEFLKEFIKENKGDVLNVDGEIIGKHDGAIFYTNGQRHGFTTTKNTTSEKAYYVISKDLDKNTIMVSHKKNNSLTGDVKEISLIQTNWMHGKSDIDDIQVLARVRYRQPLQKAIIKNQGTHLVFEDLQTVSPGQSVVMYINDEVIGGGIIE